MTATHPKPLLLEILRQLNAEQFVSGEELADRFQISRANVSLTLQQAKLFGIEIQRIHGKGYRLAAPINWLDAAAIQVLQTHPVAVQVLPITDSTNTWLMQQHDSAAAPMAVVAECQTSGRGRRGRQWTSTIGGSLTFSLRWVFPFGIARLSGLSLVIGIAIARVLHRMGLHQAKLKWPNDILIHQKKLAGILIETQGDALGPIETIIGIGINIRLPEAQRAEIGQQVTDLTDHFTTPPNRNAMLALLLDELYLVLSEFSQAGFAAFREEWMSLHAWQGEFVNILHNMNAVMEGMVIGIDDTGALLLDTAQGRETVHAGDVSLRRVP